MRIASVVGARPNFVKLAPVHKSLASSFDHTIIHTGQHYDYQMSEVFFKEFDLPTPDLNLEVGSGTSSSQSAEMINKLGVIFEKDRFDLVMVYGDTNSTFAGAYSAVKSGIRVAHVESGLRSFDRRMPEEINRILTDHISDYLFAPTETAMVNLRNEGLASKMLYTGDISVEIINNIRKSLTTKSKILEELGLSRKSYILLTLHRAENTDSKENLTHVLSALKQLDEIQFVFPIHPRTVKMLKEFHLYDELESCKNVMTIAPMGYLDFVTLMHNASKIITDSGGVQKEAYLLEVPCITIRRSTEWVETVKEGWNILADIDSKRIIDAVCNWFPPIVTPNPIFGNGRTSDTIKEYLLSLKEL